MNRFKAMASALVIPVALIGVLSQGVGPAEAQPVKRTVYSAKFLCGEYQPAAGALQREGPVKPGNYQTAINVHNPTQAPIVFVKHALLLFSSDPDNPVPSPGTFEEPQRPGNLFQAVLEEGWGLEIDCPDIREVLLGTNPDPAIFIKGYVVIETFGAREELDVVAAYTSHGFTPRFGELCSLAGSPLDGVPCDSSDPNDACLANQGICAPAIVGLVEEGFSTEVEEIRPKVF